ncbi:eotaxin-like [Cheilinus undulatus]|uniref:eotaxin-like n=1 Tax=Cheilinus undulatus TaxID=241271 RepID=UPI001BD5478A|nr:eotaxin-like [Cheilinus undulatus]
MRFSLVSVALFCLITWISLVNAVPGPVTNCCEVWSTTKIPVKRVMNYTIQSGGICPIRAVLFQTKKGTTLCSDPDSGWAKRAMQKVDRETKALLQETQSEEDGSADITPASADAPQKAKQKKNRTGRRGQGKRCKGGRNGQRKCV